MPDYQAAIAAMQTRIDATAAEDEAGFPHYAEPAGRWTRSEDGDWTGGFWVGMLWLVAHDTGDADRRALARTWTTRLLPRAKSETVFRGFLFWYGAALGDVLFGDDAARSAALEGASGLDSLYNDAAGLIPLGGEAEEAADVGVGEANIDGVPGGVPLLVWASGLSGQPDLQAHARTHAARHVAALVRDDGSVCQSLSFDPHTGEVLRRYTHKGVRDDSTWTRAQAWAMLGLAQVALRFPEQFRADAARVADWWLANLPDDHVAYWDFDDPAVPDAPRDTSGTAIAAAALLKLVHLVDSSRAQRYHQTAEAMVDALIDRHLVPIGAPSAGALHAGCYNNRIGLATEHELIWGDYFLFESLLVLQGRLDPRLT
jgi:unsaturated chondroitin disaccharide hydrolase